MLKKSIGVLCALATGLSFSALSVGQALPTAPSDAPNKADATPSTPDQYKDVFCLTALEPILPADYYACEARAAYGRQRYKHMVSMLEESASWANKDAQYILGLTYFNGDTPDVPQNRPLGLAWLSLAAERKKPQYQLTYAEARARSTPEEIEQAELLLPRLRVKYADSVAAPRAIRRFNHEIEPIEDAAREGGITYISGYSPFPESAFSIANKLHEQADADFSDWRGTVTVGKVDWANNPPSGNVTAPQQ